MSRSSTLIRLGASGIALALTFSVTSAATAGPVETRQAVMKHVGQAIKDASPFLSSGVPYDAAKVKTLMAGVAADARKLKALYPAASGADPKSLADPKVWQNKADFDKRLAAMGAAALAAGRATSTETFRPAFLSLGTTCQSCHAVYRKQK
jgi:cytochrome c556